MSNSHIQCQPAYILHQIQYRETSLILDVLTRDFGRLSILAKGVRTSKAKNTAILRPFQLLNLSYTGRNDLKTLTNVEAFGELRELQGLALYCGYYASELVCHFLHKHDPHPEVFQEYGDCLINLKTFEDMETVLRCFELNLMDKVGYGVSLAYDGKNQKAIAPAKKYRFNSEYGLLEDRNGLFSGLSLIAMQNRQFSDPQVRTEAKKLMRLVIDNNLQGKQLKSGAVVNEILKRLNHE